MKAIYYLILTVIFCSWLNVGSTMHKTAFPFMIDSKDKDKKATLAMTKEKDSSRVKQVEMDIVASDGAKLKATYYTSDSPGPGLLLLHQCNMDRRSWKTLASALAQRGVHVLTFDYRGYGETPNTGDGKNQASDIDAAMSTLISLPGVRKSKFGVGGASCGVNNAVELVKRNDKIKALMLLSGPASAEGLKYLREHPSLAIFGAASSEEDFAVKAIKEMVATSTNTASMMRELQNAGHGAPMFSADPTLLLSVTDWIVKVLK